MYDQLEASTEAEADGEVPSTEVDQDWAEVAGQEEGKARRAG